MEHYSKTGTVAMPDVPALVCKPGGAVALFPDGEIRSMTLPRARELAGRSPVMLCHGPGLSKRLGLSWLEAFDVLELFAFVRPARFCLPTPRGVAEAVGLTPIGESHEDEVQALMAAARALLGELGTDDYRFRDGAASLSLTMERAGWPWGAAVRAALGDAGEADPKDAGIDAWRVVEEWKDAGPEPPPTDIPVTAGEARQRLALLVGDGAEDRPGQRDYAAHAAAAFEPRRHRSAR